jgi:hypothetical protein
VAAKMRDPQAGLCPARDRCVNGGSVYARPICWRGTERTKT